LIVIKFSTSTEIIVGPIYSNNPLSKLL